MQRSKSVLAQIYGYRQTGLITVEDASPEVLESMEDAANIHDEEC